MYLALRFISLFLPEGNKDHQFDTEELAHRSDWHQFLFECSVQQHKTIHGKLERGGGKHREEKLHYISQNVVHFPLPAS